jgi:hypothetical protein
MPPDEPTDSPAAGNRTHAPACRPDGGDFIQDSPAGIATRIFDRLADGGAHLATDTGLIG